MSAIHLNPDELNHIAQQLAIRMSDTASTVRHETVTCDECQVVPICGIRYKCAICNNHDLCSNCASKGLHAHHEFWVIPYPLQLVQLKTKNNLTNNKQNSSAFPTPVSIPPPTHAKQVLAPERQVFTFNSAPATVQPNLFPIFPGFNPQPQPNAQFKPWHEFGKQQKDVPFNQTSC